MTRWEPTKDGDLYWYLDCANVLVDREEYIGDYVDEARLSIGNYFRTRREALAALNLIKAVLKKGGS